MIVACEACGEDFEGQRSTARFCSSACRSKPKSRPKVAVPERSGGLVAAVESELRAAGRSESFAGQLAVELARSITKPDATGVSSTSKELRLVMDAALAGVNPPAAEDVDDVDEIKERRRAKERNAARLA